ncbi:leucyl/phenylalanyl-tRNA--protein transferase [Thalassotalea euphylliae]|uniref:leucyl/phenylalanyl-tRNA--protein transferase n=1 Tax=Thalassotalea euphylliae TaxID=1655234 RepID=UPI00363D9A6A
MSQTISFIHPDSLAFPPLSQALDEPNGLLAIGGDLTPSRLISAYKSGIFPWYSEGEPIMWWSPDPRALIPTNDININRTLRKFINKQKYQVTLNKAFEQVIQFCADAPFRNEDTWITDEMQLAYLTLHEQGHAHSIEVWDEDILVGGLYGVAINGFFSGESMFYAAPNASKVALVALANHLKSAHIKFIDCQLTNPFLADMGCIEISRKQFIDEKTVAQLIVLPENFWSPKLLDY